MFKRLVKIMLGIKILFYTIKAITLVSLIFMRGLSYLAQQVILLRYRVEIINEWILCGKNPPNFYKHLDNLYHWPFNPSRNMFTTAPAIARLHLNKKGKVLDLCCGDGSNSYLFFSDISEHVDAVDVNKSALSYARKVFKKSNISFIESDILDYLSNCSTVYDLYYMGSAFDYFSKKERSKIFNLIKNQMSSSSTFVLKTPVWDKETYSCNTQVNVGAKPDYADDESVVYAELKSFFTTITTYVAEYSTRTEIIAICRR